MAKRLDVSFMSENTWEHRPELSRFANLVVEKFMSERGLEEIMKKGGEKEKGQRSRSTPGLDRKTTRGKRRKKNGRKNTSERNESAV